MKSVYVFLIVIILSCSLVSCNDLGLGHTLVGMDSEISTEMVANNSATESIEDEDGVASSGDWIDSEESELPYKINTLDTFLSEWKTSHNGTEITDARMLSNQYEDGQYYIVVPVVTNADYALKIYAEKNQYTYYVVPEEQKDSSFIDYDNSFTLQYSKKASETIADELIGGGFIKEKETDYYIAWTTAYYDRIMRVYAPTELDCDGFEQYFTLEIYTLIDGELIQVD